MSSTGAKLNPEPAAPQERKAQHLPPKSYVGAATQPPPQTNGTNGYTAPKNDSSYSKTNLNGTDNKKLVYEKHTNADGEDLTSVKPQDGFEEALKHNKATAPKEEVNGKKKQDKINLATGREAGKGWQESA